MKNILLVAVSAASLASAAQAAPVYSETLTNANSSSFLGTTTTTTNANGRTTTSSGLVRYSQTAVQDQWLQQNIGGGATVGITDTYARNGDGSAYFSGTGSNAKADLEIRFNPILLSSITSASYDWLRADNSTTTGHLVPSFRFILGNAAGVSTGYLIFEPIYNGVSSAQSGWQTSSITTNSTFWSNTNTGIVRAAGIPSCTSGGTCFDSLADWQTANPSKYIVGLSTGIGSGWAGTFTGAVDNISFTTASGVTSYNFEVAASAAVPEPATWAMLMLGFGLVGAAARRRRTAAVA